MPTPFEDTAAIPPLNPQMNLVEDIQAYFSQPRVPETYFFNPDDVSHTNTSVNALAASIQSQHRLAKPTMMPIGKLRATPTQNTKAQGKQASYLLLGCDSFATAHFQSMTGAIRQVASQFNSGEAKSPKLTPPHLFRHDATQGPAEQRTCGRAAIARYAYRRDCDSFGVILANETWRNEFLKIFDYKFGYLIPLPGKEQECLNFLKIHLDDLVLNVERVTIDNTNPPVFAIQVLNASLALGAYDVYHTHRDATAKIALNQINKLLLEAQYMAVAKIALLEAIANPQRRIPVSFTFVGGSAFGADQSIIANALNQAIDMIQRSKQPNLDICISCWSSYELGIYQQIAGKNQLQALNHILSNSQVLTQSQLQSRTLSEVMEFKESSVQNSNMNATIVHAMKMAIADL